jgi:hypothetical protein
MVQRNELPSSEAYLGSSGAQTVLRGYINEAIAGYIKVAKPLDADISGTPKVLHSGLETGPNGKKVSILYLVLSNVGQAKAVGSWMNLLDTGTPALNIWPPGVREAQTSETALKVFKAHWDKENGRGGLWSAGAGITQRKTWKRVGGVGSRRAPGCKRPLQGACRARKGQSS